MKYLILDKQQRVEISGQYSYVITRMMEELDKKGIEYDFAFNHEIEISFNGTEDKITARGKDIRDYTHIFFRGLRLDRPIEYETRYIILDYIDTYNLHNLSNQIKIQNSLALKTLPYYDKIYISHFCSQNNIPIIDTYYKSSGAYSVEPFAFSYPQIIKHYAGMNDLRMIDGKEKVKKNVYLIEKQEDFQQENLKDKDQSEFIIQEFIPSGEDFRVFVKQGEAFAGFTRRATEGFMTVNKGEYTKIDFSKNKDLKDFAEMVAMKLHADFIAVDMMKKDGKPILQEISLNPGFKAFETKTDGDPVNIAEAIIDSI